jgi:hypothetical protein
VSTDFERDIARAYWLRTEAKSMMAEADEILDGYKFDQIRDYPAGDFILKVEPNRRFDASTAKRNLSEDVYTSILVPTPNSTLAKKVLTEDQYRAAQKDYGIKRSIVPVTDAE